MISYFFFHWNEYMCIFQSSESTIGDYFTTSHQIYLWIGDFWIWLVWLSLVWFKIDQSYFNWFAYAHKRMWNDQYTDCTNLLYEWHTPIQSTCGSLHLCSSHIQMDRNAVIICISYFLQARCSMHGTCLWRLPRLCIYLIFCIFFINAIFVRTLKSKRLQLHRLAMVCTYESLWIIMKHIFHQTDVSNNGFPHWNAYALARLFHVTELK